MQVLTDVGYLVNNIPAVDIARGIIDVEALLQNQRKISCKGRVFTPIIPPGYPLHRSERVKPDSGLRFQLCAGWLLRQPRDPAKN